MSLPELIQQYRQLSDRIVKAVKTLCPEGSTVHWERRGYRQTGHVIAHLGFSANHLRLRVFNEGTSKVSDVSMYDIEEVQRGISSAHTEMNFLHLHLKGAFFEQIKAGEKTDEFRLRTAYWRKRLEGRSYDGILLLKGYPMLSNPHTKLKRAWRGFRRTTITHPHFGPDPVDVYAIDVSCPLAGASHDIP